MARFDLTANIPSPAFKIPHYYGDIIRQLFFVIALIVALSIPFGVNSRPELIVAIPMVVVLILLAGLTSPHAGIVMFLDMLVSVAGVFFTELIAISAYKAGAYVPLAVLEFMSILFIVASYFSIKTVRAMLMHTLGHTEQAGEFDDGNNA